MTITHDKDACTLYLFDEQGHEVGHIMYRIGSGGELRATHTKVFPSFEGKGYALVLVNALVEYAEQQNLKIVPVCSYVARCFERDPERYSSVM
ncbi:MAG: GNAT family N-acetyltransferase [Raoultibacter sp.]|jgi:predicted GNAT family acetyltransferase